MYQPLKNLTASQQVGALFFIVFGLLLLASITAVVLSLREGDDSAASDQHRADLHNFEGVLRTSWFMALVFWAYSKRRKADFDELARMPLEDDTPARNPGSKTP